MEFKFLKLRDLQGKTPSSCCRQKYTLSMCGTDDSNLHKAVPAVHDQRNPFLLSVY